MSVLLIIFGILFFYALFCIVFSYFVGDKVTHPKTNSFEKEIEEMKALGFDSDSFFKNTPHEEYTCLSYGDYVIHYCVFRNGESRKTVLIAHGYVGNRYSSLVYVNMFLKMGYNCIIFDQRNHGYNVKSFTSLGYYEEMDLRAVSENALRILGPQEKFGLFGISMGAATCLMAAAKIKKLDFVIEDSGYSSLKDLILSLVGPFWGKIVYPGLATSSLYLKLRYGFYMRDISPKKCVSTYGEDFPLFLIHSKSDKKVPFAMFEPLCNAKKGRKTLYVTDNAAHAKMIFSEEETYVAKVGEFLESVEKM